MSCFNVITNFRECNSTALREMFTELKSLLSDEDKPLLEQLAKVYKVSL